MGPWSDWDPIQGGEIRYETIGTAPNRALVVSWIDVPLFGIFCNTFQGKFQIVLRETTNIIENNIEYKTNCPDGGAGGSDIAVQGIHNIDGTVAVVVPGRNATGWEATNESHQYTPTGPAISNVQWFDQLGNLVGTGTDITVTPTSTTTYTAIAQECPNSYSDDVTIIFSPAITTSVIVEDNLCPGQIAGNIDADLNRQCEYSKNALLRYQQVLGYDLKSAMYYLLSDGTAPLSALYRYCLAISMLREPNVSLVDDVSLFQRVTKRLEESAVLQYTCFPGEYDSRWNDFIPAKFSQDARRIYSGMLSRCV